MLTKEIASSKQLWRMGHDHVLLWLSMLPHLDRDGRISGEPAVVRGLCAPLAEWRTADVERMLYDFSDLSDVSYYEDGQGERYLQFDNFAKHQQGFKPGMKQYEREPASSIPGPAECHPVERPAALRPAAKPEPVEVF